jgi:hypothetical protein
MTDILDELRKVEQLRGDTYSCEEVLGMVSRAADEIDRMRARLQEIHELATGPHDVHTAGTALHHIWLAAKNKSMRGAV